jgi:hypothetical protein
MADSNEFGKNGVGLNDYLRILDVASALRKEGELVDQQLNLEDQKLQLKNHLLKTAESTGEKLSQEQIDAAINTYFEDLYSFKEPERDFKYKLAELYVDRVKIAKTVGIPSLAVLTTAGLITSGVYGVNAIITHSEEKGVESKIEELYQTDQGLESNINTISTSQVISQLPETEKKEIKSILINSQTNLQDKVEPFLGKYCQKGEADDKVTQKNYKELEKQIPNIESFLVAIGLDLNKAKGVIQTQVRLLDIRKDLETIIGEVRNAKTVDQFKDRAEVAYKNGVVCIDNRQISCAEDNKNKLVNIKTDINDYGALTTRVDQIYADVKSVAKEDIAKKKGEELYSVAKESGRVVDVNKLRSTTKQLESLDTILNQEYELRIVSKPGIKSGIDRYYEGQSSGYYLIVEAVDSNGEILSKEITSIENGETKRVTMWGRKVAESTYESLKSDKMDDGLIQNNILGKKQKGYLNENITMPGVEKGEITNW